MSAPPPSRVLVLRIERQTEPIAGTLSAEGGEPHPFFGWLGLARAMERVLGDGPPASAGDPSPDRGSGAGRDPLDD